MQCSSHVGVATRAGNLQHGLNQGPRQVQSLYARIQKQYLASRHESSLKVQFSAILVSCTPTSHAGFKSTWELRTDGHYCFEGKERYACRRPSWPIFVGGCPPGAQVSPVDCAPRQPKPHRQSHPRAGNKTYQPDPPHHVPQHLNPALTRWQSRRREQDREPAYSKSFPNGQ